MGIKLFDINKINYIINVMSRYYDLNGKCSSVSAAIHLRCKDPNYIFQYGSGSHFYIYCENLKTNTNNYIDNVVCEGSDLNLVKFKRNGEFGKVFKRKNKYLIGIKDRRFSNIYKCFVRLLNAKSKNKYPEILKDYKI